MFPEIYRDVNKRLSMRMIVYVVVFLGEFVKNRK